MKKTITYDYSQLIGKIAEKGYSRNKLSKEIHLNENSLGEKLNNGLSFKSSQISSIVRVLGIEDEKYGAYFFTLKV